MSFCCDIIILVIVFGTIILFRNIYLPKSEIKDIYTYDFSKTKIFSSDFMGISLIYPDTLKEGTLSYKNNPEEHISFFTGDVHTGVPPTEEFFDVWLENGKFDPNNVSEFVWDNLEEVPIISYLVNKAYAMPPPTEIKIKNVQQIQIADNKYYSYAFNLRNKRYDVFILPRENSYLRFEFYNLDSVFIKNILLSVKNI